MFVWGSVLGEGAQAGAGRTAMGLHGWRSRSGELGLW